MTKKRTAVRRALLLTAAVLLLLCCAYIDAESGHHCTGEGCPICAHIHFCMDVLMSLAAAITMGGLMLAAVRLRVQSTGKPVCVILTAMTPVMLRVRQDR
jgi:hypothetical protein